MIINKDLNPERSLYFIGSLIIDVLNKSDEVNFDFLEVYTTLKEEKNISMSLFSLSLDWLFLNDIVDLKNGMIKRCF